MKMTRRGFLTRVSAAAVLAATPLKVLADDKPKETEVVDADNMMLDFATGQDITTMVLVSPTGKRMMVTKEEEEVIYVYPLSTPFDATTASQPESYDKTKEGILNAFAEFK